MRFLTVFLAALALGSVLMADIVSAEKRIALVLGNNAYNGVPALQKAVNDAKGLEAKLTALGFEVISGTDLNRRDMVRKIQDLAARIQIGDKVVFFYAGHGVQIGRSSYLLATDIPATSGIEEEFVRFEGFDVEQILNMIRGRGAQTTIMILDACRNNPFATTSVSRAIGGITRGLVPIQAVNEGTFIMYSADEGQEAFDSLGDTDADANSVFTRSLLRLLDEQDLELTDMAKKVRVAVYETVQKTFQSKTQQPFYVDRLFGEFYFNAAKQTDEDMFWESIKNTTTAASFKVYLQVYPDGKYKAEAERKIGKRGWLEDDEGSQVKRADRRDSRRMAYASLLPLQAADFFKLMVDKAVSGGDWLAPQEVAARNRAQVFPKSSSVMLTDSDLNQLSCLELWLARNEIYDRNGYCFVTSLGIQHFDNAGCRTTDTNILKNWTENRNVKLIMDWEDKKNCGGQ